VKNREAAALPKKHRCVRCRDSNASLVHIDALGGFKLWLCKFCEGRGRDGYPLQGLVLSLRWYGIDLGTILGRELARANRKFGTQPMRKVMADVKKLMYRKLVTPASILEKEHEAEQFAREAENIGRLVRGEEPLPQIPRMKKKELVALIATVFGVERGSVLRARRRRLSRTKSAKRAKTR
jgi:hypothetical protein